MHLCSWDTIEDVLKNICLKGIEFSSIFREVINMQSWAKKRPIFFFVNNNFSNVRIFGDNSSIFWDFLNKCLENLMKPSQNETITNETQFGQFQIYFKKIEKQHLIVIFHPAFCNVKTLKTAKMPKNISLKKFHKISKTIPNMPKLVLLVSKYAQLLE